MKNQYSRGDLGVQVARDNAGRNVIHDDEAVDQFRVIPDQTGRDPRAAIVSDQCDAPGAERLQELDDIVGHCPLVVAFRRLVGVAVSAQVGSYHPITGGKRRNLEAPGEAGLWEAVQEDHWGARPGFQPELADAVCPARGSTDGGHLYVVADLFWTILFFPDLFRRLLLRKIVRDRQTNNPL